MTEPRLIKEVEGLEHARAFIGTQFAEAIYSHSTHIIGFCFDALTASRRLAVPITLLYATACGMSHDGDVINVATELIDIFLNPLQALNQIQGRKITRAVSLGSLIFKHWVGEGP